MPALVVTPIIDGSYYIEAPGAGLRLLCGCPENIVKHLIKGGIIRQVERGGARFETGPNAILLSEGSVEAGCFRNLAEFPVLQMLYRQGMILPGHPNNDGTKPLIVGLRSQVEAVASYIYEGNYGLANALDIVGGGIDAAEAEDILRTKRAFAFGRFRESAELLELRPIEGPIVALKGGAFLRRTGGNRYEIIYAGEAVSVDLRATERTPPPYDLPARPLPSTAFGIVHIGEGDGWDPDRPCMSSLVLAGDERWLVDAGPNIDESLAALGLSPADLTGILHSHVHDDHFVGLTGLMRGERRLVYCALPCVRASATHKLAALAGIAEKDFGRYFEIRDLEARSWNRIGRIEVFPIPAPHPVENSLFRIRKAGGSSVYAHYADLTSFAVMDSLSRAAKPEAAMPESRVATARRDYLEFADLKKVDAAGGMIHGAASDFAEDISTVLLLSHCPPQSQTRGDMAGRVAAFGEHSLLDPGPGEWVEELALRALRRRFPSASSAGLESLVRESALSGGGLRSGTEGLLVRAGVRIDTLYLILSGQVERLGRGGVGRASLTAGAIVGERSLALNGISAYDFRPLPGAALFPIPAARWKQFLREASIAGSSRERLELCTQLEALPFFEGIAQSEIAIRAADESTLVALESGTVLATGNGHLWIVLEGCLEILSADSLVETASLGGIFGEEQILDDSCCLFTARVSTPTRCAQIDKSLVEEHPLLLWRAKEVFERRLAAAGAVFDFAWRKEYEVGLDAIDDQHRQIFSAMGAVRQVPGRGGKGLTIALKALTELNNFHFAEEEKILALADYPDLDEHRRAHDRLREDLEAIAKSNKITRETDTFLKDCFLRHTLIFDRRYIPFLEKK